MKTIINCNLICLFNRLVSYPIWFSWQLAGRLAVAAGSWHTKTARQESICPSVTLTDDKLSRAGQLHEAELCLRLQHPREGTRLVPRAQPEGLVWFLPEGVVIKDTAKLRGAV